MTDHRTYDELAVGFALHALQPEDEAAFSAHLPGCERCARTVAETFEVMATLATDDADAEPSAGLQDRLRAAALVTEQVGTAPAAPSVLPLPLPRRAVAPRRRTMLLAAAAALIVGLGAGNVVLGVSLQHARTDAAQQQQLVGALLGKGSATLAALTGSSGRQVAAVVARDGRVQLVTDGLPANDKQDSVYVLWGMGQGAPVALDTFDVTGGRPELHAISSARAGAAGFPGYGISIERGRSAPPAPTDVVASGTQPS